MHKKAESIWKKVQEKLCQITTTGIDGIKYKSSDIILSGSKASTVARFTGRTKSVSNHSYGTAIDINPDAEYTINGKKYMPYASTDAGQKYMKILYPLLVEKMIQEMLTIYFGKKYLSL